MSDARTSFDQALQSCPESLPALEGAAQIAYATRSPAASDLLHRILLQRPDDQTSHAMLGTLSFQHGDCPAAIDHFDHSLALVQKSIEAQRELGACLWAQGEHQKAEEAFRRIAEQDPNEKNLLQLAFVQWKSKDLDAALTTLQPLADLKCRRQQAILTGGANRRRKRRHAARCRMAAHRDCQGSGRHRELSSLRYHLVQSRVLPGRDRCGGLRDPTIARCGKVVPGPRCSSGTANPLRPGTRRFRESACSRSPAFLRPGCYGHDPQSAA